jgi:hypothetical protein
MLSGLAVRRHNLLGTRGPAHQISTTAKQITNGRNTNYSRGKIHQSSIAIQETKKRYREVSSDSLRWWSVTDKLECRRNMEEEPGVLILRHRGCKCILPELFCWKETRAIWDTLNPKSASLLKFLPLASTQAKSWTCSNSNYSRICGAWGQDIFERTTEFESLEL